MGLTTLGPTSYCQIQLRIDFGWQILPDQQLNLFI